MADEGSLNFECCDIRVFDDDAVLIYNGPRFLRCQLSDCGALVTHGQIQEFGACICGGHRVQPATQIKAEEQLAIALAEFPMLPWEREALTAAFLEA